ncbi:uncharacterized protein BDW70DRAFT_133843 [Aspergillus foveolatus]|uniref:uncharacterized protein n=1 Tax=Aspergillus foveolatus TaxID=210207 RepID=UPI003CCD37B0
MAASILSLKSRAFASARPSMSLSRRLMVSPSRVRSLRRRCASASSSSRLSHRSRASFICMPSSDAWSRMLFMRLCALEC